MKIAVDAMGGDYAPEVVIGGALLAKPQCPAEIVLVGPNSQLQGILANAGSASELRVVNAPDTIGMEEAGPLAIKKKREASLPVAMRLLADGAVDAVVSAGNSAAIVATARHYVGLVHGLRRPALAVPLPVPGGSLLLIDAGGHTEASAIHLTQSAALAHAYLKVTSGIERPRIGLLNIGRERIKGTQEIQRAYVLLERSSLNFVGNLEPEDFFTDRGDAVVCDGFVGNVLLKLHECWAQLWLHRVEDYLQRQAVSKEMEQNLRQCFQHLGPSYDYRDVGGAPLLGLCKTVVVAHGRSREVAISNAIHLAVHSVQRENIAQAVAYLENHPILTELRQYSTRWLLERWKNKWGANKNRS
jgi:phosphate acyltransferase